MKGIAIIFLLLAPSLVLSDIVAPKSAVTSHVTIRSSNSSNSEKLGELLPSQTLPYAGSVNRWHKVELKNGGTGFVSKRWTDVTEGIAPTFKNSPFTVHFIDVGIGDAAIIDIGDKEIIIDGGNNISDLHKYVSDTGLIDGDIELVIVTHGDQDHWKGLKRLLGFDGVLDKPLVVDEFWDAGYNRDCNKPTQGGRINYRAFIQDVKDIIPSDKFKRPLEDFHAPTDVSKVLEPFTIPSIPEVTFTILHSQSNPEHAECSYMVNNASIVLMIEIDGVKMLFTGDANGKERNESAEAKASHVEKSILDAEKVIGGSFLQTDLLKVPHHGSETSNTKEFISATNPKFVIISATTNHHLPKQTVLDRYISNERIILRTDLNRERMIDHIICGKSNGQFNCLYQIDLNR